MRFIFILNVFNFFTDKLQTVDVLCINTKEKLAKNPAFTHSM